MPNKLTDAEVKKAWWSCNQGESSYICLRCPLYDDEVITRECAENLKAKVFDLINRQEGEIKVKNKLLDIAEAKFKKYEAEIERLKLHNNLMASERELHKIGASDLILKAKEEAYKELVELAKSRKRIVDVSTKFGYEVFAEVITVEDIDNLLNELVGGDNGN